MGTRKKPGIHSGKRLSIILTLIISLMMIFTMSFPKVSFAAAGDEPEHHKMRTNNGDGTYKLELNVTGDADTEVHTKNNVNVLIIYDASSSMTSNNVTTNPNRNRADYAENVVHDFIEGLRSYQTGDGSNIQVAVVTFGPQASGRQSWTSDLSGGANGANRFFDDGVDGTVTNSNNYNQNNGTNWEAALQQGQQYLNRLEDDDPTFVILVTDGACTASGNGNNAINPNQPPNRPWTDFRPFYNAARDEALAIESRADTTLFGIYAYGTEADLLDDLIYYGQNGSDRPGMSGGTVTTDNYYNASNTAELTEAVEDIFQQIVETLGITETAISDGTTSGVTTSSGTIDLLDVDESSYEYWLEMSYNTSSNTFSRTDPVSGEVTTYKLTDNGDGTITVTNNASGSTVCTVTGTMSMGKFKYKWDGANALYNKTPPAATFTGTSVDWDLSSVGTLLDGVTYSVTFDVYPSQETYDLIADLKNEVIDYDDLDPNIQKYLIDEGNHVYTLETNTGATLSYTDNRTDDGPQTAAFTDQLPRVATDAEEMDLQKIWLGSYNNEEKQPVTMHVLRDGEVIMVGDEPYEIILEPDDFQATMYIATGLMKVSSAGVVTVLDEGHDYKLKETGEVSFHWDLAMETLHPMIINGTLTMLALVEAADVPSGMGDDDYYVDGDKHYYRIGDNVYTESESSGILTATNTRRSDLNLNKVVTGDNPPEDAEFTFTITLTNPSADEDDPEDFWFSIRDKDKNYVTADRVDSGATADPEDSRYYIVEDGSAVTLRIRATDSLRFTNVPIGTEYTITESSLPEGFVLTTAEQSDEPIDDAEVADPIEAEDPAFDDEDTFTGTIVQGNHRYTVTFTNDYQLVDVTITKVWEDNDDQDGIRPGTEPFNSYLTLKADGEVVEKVPSIEVDPSDSNKYIVKWTGLPKNNDAGEEIEYTVEESEIEGYTTEGSPAENGGTITNTHEPEKTEVEITKVWEDNDDQDGIRPTTSAFAKKLTLKADGKAVTKPAPTVTDNGDGTFTVKWTGLDKYASGDEIAYTVEEAKIDGYTTEGSPAENGGTITNTHEPEEIDIEITKVWDDGDDQDGIRPSADEFAEYLTLKADGEIVPDIIPEVTDNGDGTYTATWTGLDKCAGGKEIKYTVEESEIEGYTTDGSPAKNGGTITNTHEIPEPVTIDVTKVWDDGDNKDGIRPDSVTVKLLANGEAVEGKTLTLNEANGWKGSFTDLEEVDEEGKEITYTVEEEMTDVVTAEDTASTYGVSYEGSAKVGFTITNTHTPKDQPKTGDSNNLTTYCFTMLGACALLVLLAVYRRRRNA